MPRFIVCKSNSDEKAILVTAPDANAAIEQAKTLSGNKDRWHAVRVTEEI